MSVGWGETVIFCLAGGVLIGALFLIFKFIRLLLGSGKLTAFIFDMLFCLLCGAIVFLSALVVDKGRLRFIQAALQLTGAVSTVLALDPVILAAAKLTRSILKKPVKFIVGRIKGAIKLPERKKLESKGKKRTKKPVKKPIKPKKHLKKLL